MAIRFRRTVKLAPGVRLNFSGSGVSVGVGPRGTSMSFGSRGAFLNAGIPGTGLYTRQKLDSAASVSRSITPDKVNVRAQINVDDDGNVKFLDENGTPLNEYSTNLAKRQKGELIRQFLQDSSDEINAKVEALAQIHWHTPKPTQGLTYTKREFDQPVPPFPEERPIGFFDRLFGRRAGIEADNAKLRHLYAEELKSWQSEKDTFETGEEQKAHELQRKLREDVQFMHAVLEESMLDIVWPRETLASFEIRDDGKTVALDVDLPEVEDLPRRVTSVPARGYKLNVKDLKEKALAELYARHVHSVGFRIIGEVFATLPAVQQVMLSAFTQRIDQATGHETDAYVYSVNVGRAAWAKINFANLKELNVIAAFERFELRRSMGKSGVFRPVEPLPDRLAADQ